MSCWNRFSSSRALARSLASRLDSGSSSRNTAGSCTSARASATRWRSPPESWRGLRPSRCSMPSIPAARRASLLPLPGRHPGRTEREDDVAQHGLVRVERIALEHHGDASRARRQAGDDVTADEHVAGGRLLQARDRAQQGRLAAAGRPEQDEVLPLAGGQVDPVDGAHPAAVEMLLQVADLDRRHLVSSRRCRSALATATGRRSVGSAPPRRPPPAAAVTSPRAARANMFGMTKVANTSPSAVLAVPG